MAYLDLMSLDNHVLFNVNIARVFGISTAIYWGELLNVLGKVQKKKTYNEDGFFKLDRKYIEQRTTLTEEEQLLCDYYLIEANILRVGADTDTISVNVVNMMELIANGDKKELDKLAKKVKANKKTKAETRRASIQKNLKLGVKEQEPLKTALDNWIDTIFSEKKPMSVAIRDIFIKTIKEYSSDINIQLKLIELATTKVYTVAEWTIKYYEDLKAKGLITTQKVSTGLGNQTF